MLSPPFLVRAVGYARRQLRDFLDHFEVVTLDDVLRDLFLKRNPMPTQPYFLKDGKRVPGVTTIISNVGWNRRALMHWAWKEGVEGRDYKKTSEAAADIGTIAHAMAEAYIKGQPMPVLPADPEALRAVQNAFAAFVSWLERTKLRIVASEVPLVSEAYHFGGTMDAVAVEEDGSHALLDFKSGRDTYTEHLLQLAAYGELWNENHPDKLISRFHLLRWGKEDGSFHHHFYPRLDLAWDAFKHALALHSLHQDLERIS